MNWHLQRALLGILAFALVTFSAARWASQLWQQKRTALATQWSSEGDELVTRGSSRDAVVAYRNALAYKHDDPELSFRLAGALKNAGELDEAEAYLLLLRDREPGNGRYNLALARIEAQRHDTAKAIEYYQAALLSQWRKDEVANRSVAWSELIRLLLDTGDTQQAVAQTLALSADLPKDDPRQIEAAQLLLQQRRLSEAHDALSGYLQAKPRDPTALALSGKLLLQQKRYKQALATLERAQEVGASSDDVRLDLETARQALALDPALVPNRPQEQADRLQAMLRRVEDRMLQCEPNGLLFQQADAWMRSSNPRAMERDEDMAQNIVDFVTTREQEMRSCPGDSAIDRAIRLIGTPR